MPLDLLGPASAPNATTTRPADSRVFGADDTFFKDCSSPVARDGTKVQAGYLNGLLQQIRRAIRGMGIAENNANDDMLLEAIRKAAGDKVAAAAATQPIYPEIITGNGAFTFTSSTGQIIINAGQQWVHRGLNFFSTDLFSAGNRTFATNASKVYHLVWHAAGTGRATPAAAYPSGRFFLEDVADAAVYNPSALAEIDPALDSTFDRMLVAAVLTDGANALTVTPLTNKAGLSLSTTDVATSFGAAAANTQPTYNGTPRILFWTTPAGADGSQRCAHRFALNWARTPRVAALHGTIGHSGFTGATPGYAEGHSNWVYSRSVSRYRADASISSDWLLGAVWDGSALTVSGPFSELRLDAAA